MGGTRAEVVKNAPVTFDPSSINLDRIIQIESSGRPDAFNKASGARGLAQITPIALEDYNNLNPDERYGLEQLFDPQINQRIANWMLTERIPQMLEHFRIPVTLENILWAYNAGIGRVKENVMPEETVNYIRQYKEAGDAVQK